MLRMSEDDARKAGLTDKPKKRTKRPRTNDLPKGEAKVEDNGFDALCVRYGVPLPDCEVRFHPTRKWRLDYVFDGWLALEKEGGVWTNGRHTRGPGFIKDMAKYNEAQLAGYVVLRATPQQIESGEIFETIKRALGMEQSELP